jgi:hypothetical protein
VERIGVLEVLVERAVDHHCRSKIEGFANECEPVAAIQNTKEGLSMSQHMIEGEAG